MSRDRYTSFFCPALFGGHARVSVNFGLGEIECISTSERKLLNWPTSSCLHTPRLSPESPFPRGGDQPLSLPKFNDAKAGLFSYELRQKCSFPSFRFDELLACASVAFSIRLDAVCLLSSLHSRDGVDLMSFPHGLPITFVAFFSTLHLNYRRPSIAASFAPLSCYTVLRFAWSTSISFSARSGSDAVGSVLQRSPLIFYHPVPSSSLPRRFTGFVISRPERNPYCPGVEKGTPATRGFYPHSPRTVGRVRRFGHSERAVGRRPSRALGTISVLRFWRESVVVVLN